LIFISSESFPIGVDESRLDDSGAKLPVFRRYVSAQTSDKSKDNATRLLYKLIGITKINDKYKPVYVAIDKRGVKTNNGTIVEYNKEKSMLDSNNLPETVNISESTDVKAYVQQLIDLHDLAHPENKYSKEVKAWFGDTFNTFYSSDYNSNISEYEIEATEDQQVNTLLNNQIANTVNDIIESESVPNIDISALKTMFLGFGIPASSIDTYVQKYAQGILDAFTGDLRHFLSENDIDIQREGINGLESFKMNALDYLNQLAGNIVDEDIQTNATWSQEFIDNSIQQEELARFNEYISAINGLELSKAQESYLSSKGLTKEQLTNLSPTEENMGILLKLLCH
jgi:hypothetical protein